MLYAAFRASRIPDTSNGIQRRRQDGSMKLPVLQAVVCLPLARDPQHDLAAPMPGLELLVRLADLVQVEDLIYEGLYLSALDHAVQLVQSRPLSRREDAVQDLVLLVEGREISLPTEDGRDASEGPRSRNAIDHGIAADVVEDGVHARARSVVESRLGHV